MDNHMSISNNYLRILKKIYKKETKGYFLTKKGATRSDIDSILRSKDVLTAKAKRIADALNISVDTLISGKIERIHIENDEFKPTKEERKMEAKLYDLEGLSKEKLDILQEMIDNWKEEDLNKRKEDRKKTTQHKKNNLL